MKKFCAILVVLLLSGCASNRYVINKADGINTREARAIALENLLSCATAHKYWKSGRVVDGKTYTDWYPFAEHYWVVVFSSKTALGLEIYFVVIDKQTGNVLRAKDDFNYKCPQCRMFEGLEGNN